MKSVNWPKIEFANAKRRDLQFMVMDVNKAYLILDNPKKLSSQISTTFTGKVYSVTIGTKFFHGFIWFKTMINL